jgi:pyrroline-5-carboxylate reductase
MIALFGCGVMGQVILRGLLKNEGEKVAIIDLPKVIEDLGLIYRNENISFFSDATEFLSKNPNCPIVLAVKPYQLEDLLNRYKLDSHLVITIISGKTCKYYESAGIKKVVRMMTNICCSVDAAPVVLCPSEHVNEEELMQAKRMFDPLGEVLLLKEESNFDVVTAVVGSGPAVGLEVIEGVALGGVRMGLTREMALRLAAYSILGAAKMILEKNEQPAHLRDKICTPGGCTIAGIESLEIDGFKGSLMKAVRKITESFHS